VEELLVLAPDGADAVDEVVLLLDDADVLAAFDLAVGAVVDAADAGAPEYREADTTAVISNAVAVGLVQFMVEFDPFTFQICNRCILSCLL